MDDMNIILQLNSLFERMNSQHPSNIANHSEEFANLLGNLLNALASGEKSILEATNATPQTLSDGSIGFSLESSIEEDQAISEEFVARDSDEIHSTLEEALSAVRLTLLEMGIPLVLNPSAEKITSIVSMKDGSEKTGEDALNLEGGMSDQVIHLGEVREVTTYISSIDGELTEYGQQPLISGEPEPGTVLFATEKGGHDKKTILTQTNEPKPYSPARLSNSVESGQHVVQEVDHQLSSRLSRPLEFVAEYKNPLEVVYPKPRPVAEEFALKGEFSSLENAPFLSSQSSSSNRVTLEEVGNVIQSAEPPADDESGVTNNIPQVAQESLSKNVNSQLSGDEFIKDQGTVGSDWAPGKDEPSRESIHLESITANNREVKEVIKAVHRSPSFQGEVNPLPKTATEFEYYDGEKITTKKPPGQQIEHVLTDRGELRWLPSAQKESELDRLAGAQVNKWINQVEHEIVAMQKTGKSHLRIQCVPEDLGRIDLRLVSSSEGTSVSIVAENPSTVHLLDRHLNQLRQSLLNAGINLGDLAVSLGYGHSDQSLSNGMIKASLKMSHHQGKVVEEPDESNAHYEAIVKLDDNSIYLDYQV